MGRNKTIRCLATAQGDAALFAFGAGAFLVNAQAHTLILETAPGPDITGDGEPDWTLTREGGQLLLLRVPGA